MSQETHYCLAMYDVRGKQEFIFRTNKLKEMVGGSCIIRDVYRDYLYPAAMAYRDQNTDAIKNLGKENRQSLNQAIYSYKDKKKNACDNKLSVSDKPEAFSVTVFKKRMDEGQYIGEVVYDGGGNFYILYKNKKTFEGVNKIFYRLLLENIGSLNVLSCCTLVSDNNLLDYKKDSDELRKIHDKLEASESIVRPISGIPFVQVDSATSMPLSELETIYIEQSRVMKDKVSTESSIKYRKYRKEYDAKGIIYGEKILDNLIKEKGVDSLLAVIFIDGNNMGAQVQALFKNKMEASTENSTVGGESEEIALDYETRVTKQREFSESIQKHYVDERLSAIERRLREKNGISKEDANSSNHTKQEEKQSKKQRMVVFAGDEMSFIVKAEDAWDAVQAYFEGLNENLDSGEEYRSSCAGIAIFHSHAPYSEAYKIAEECCESGKKRMKSRKNPEKGTCYVDFQYCRSGMGRDLDTIRKEEQGSLVSKWPWLLKDNTPCGEQESKKLMKTIVEKVADDLNSIDSRTNVKSLIKAAEKSLTDFNLEMNRIYAHQEKAVREKIQYTFGEELLNDLNVCLNVDENIEKEKAENKTSQVDPKEYRRRLLYDIVTVYDLWFKK